MSIACWVSVLDIGCDAVGEAEYEGFMETYKEAGKQRIHRSTCLISHWDTKECV